MKKIKKFLIIAIVITIIVIIGILIVLFKLNNMGTDGGINTQFENQEFYVPESKLQDVNNRNKYFAAKKILNSYFSYIEQLNGDQKILYETDEKEEIKKQQEKEAIKAIKQIIGAGDEKQEYIVDDSIKEEGKKYSKSYVPKIKRMLVTEKSSNINIYIIEATIGEVNTQIAIKTDSKNMTFSIFPESYLKKYSYDNNKIVAKITDNDIEKNNFNTYNYSNITDEYMAKQYFSDYIDNVKNNISEAYDSLDMDYAKKRFGNINSYTRYIEKNKEKLQSAALQKYQFKEYNNYNQYVLIDQYNNYYIIRETAIMQYSIILDTYTIDLPEYVEKYNKANDGQKTAYCINRFIQSLNDENYTFAYSLLADGFKNNYFKTQVSFENYIKQNSLQKQTAKFEEFSNEGNVYYTYKVLLTNGDEDTNPVEKTFIVKLGEGTNFELSFNVD